MMNEAFAYEAMPATVSEVWGPTLGIRILSSKDENVVQQFWRSSTGKGEWRNLPVVEE